MKNIMDTLNKNNDLFHLPPQYNKEAAVKMPPNIEIWGEVVFDTFAEQYPELAEMSGGNVIWNKGTLNEADGFATGYIIVLGGAGNNVKIPIVIKDFELKPIDIFEYDGKIFFINSENVGRALKEQDNIGTVSHPNRNVFPSTNYVQWLSKQSSVKSWNKKIKSLEKVARTVGIYADKVIENIKSVEKLASDPCPNAKCYFIKRNSFNNVSAIGFDRGVITKMSSGTPEDVVRSIGATDDKLLKDSIKMAFNNGTSILTEPMEINDDIGFSGINITEGFVNITKPGVYESIAIKPDGDTESVPVLALDVYNFSNKFSEPNGKLFIVSSANKLNYSIQNSAIGKPIDAEGFDFNEMVIPITQANRYDQGCILFPDDDIVERCTEIVKIDRIEATPTGEIRIFLKTSGGLVHYLINDDFKRILPLSASPLYSTNSNENFVGPTLMFIRLNKIVELISSAEKQQRIYDNMVTKTAGGDKIIVRMANGVIITKIGSKQFEDSPDRFIARISSCGIEPEKVATIVTAVSGGAPVNIHGLKLQDDPIPNYDQVGVLKLAEMIRGMKHDIIKAAAAIGMSDVNRDISMSVAGIGLADEENIRYFVHIIPTLEDMSGVLGKMLLCSRTGEIDVNEGAIKSALMNVTKIIGRLRELASNIQ
ncbi:MAG: hypothetical protein WCY30_00170 [Candidatus Neomarinimicrobiota bacterium]|jgi:hypothetical protein